MAKIIKKEEANIVWTDDPDQEISAQKNKKDEKREINPPEYLICLRREKKHRGGKVVTVIYGDFHHNLSHFKSLAKKLKKYCGTGGTFKGETIEIQGDFVDHSITFLNKAGYQTKVTGG